MPYTGKAGKSAMPLHNPKLRVSGLGVHQQGLTLLELLVGITIGLMIIAAALGTLFMSRMVASSTSEVAALQQQASYAMHVLGTQIRQAGALEAVFLDTPANPAPNSSYISFPTWSGAVGSADFVVTGTQGDDEDPDELVVGTQTPVSTFASTSIVDCLGNNISSTTTYSSTFTVTDGQLTCLSSADPLGVPQPIISNVKDFQIRFRNATFNKMTGSSTLSISDSHVANETFTQKNYVKAVEICLELEGTERVADLGADDTYLNCQGDADAQRGDRRRMVFRNVFNIRPETASL